MNVNELMKVLENLDPDTLVILSSDPEGNEYSELEHIELNMRFDGDEIGIAQLTPDLFDQGFSEDDVIEGQPAIVLY